MIINGADAADVLKNQETDVVNTVVTIMNIGRRSMDVGWKKPYRDPEKMFWISAKELWNDDEAHRENKIAALGAETHLSAYLQCGMLRLNLGAYLRDMSLQRCTK